MKLFGSMENRDGILHIGGISVEDLRMRYGTPLYVMDEDLIRANIKNFKENFKSKKLNTEILYASKAFLNSYMAKLVRDENLSIDVVSAGELYTVLRQNFPSERIYFHGNNKSESELTMAVENRIGRVILDNIEEARRLNELVLVKEGETTYRQKVQLRVNPGIDAHTHEYIKTTTNDSKFGESIFDEQLKEDILEINKMEKLDFRGLHCHIGSQIFEGASFVEASNRMIEYISSLSDLGIEVKELNLGGGFGIYYSEGDRPLDLNIHFKNLIENIERLVEEKGLGLEKILIEPGRSLVANAGTTLYTVGGVKKTYGGKEYIFIDGGMTDNIRPALYQAKYEADIGNDLGRKDKKLFTIAGKACESGDIIVRDCETAEPKPGDIIAVASTGAYCYSMSSNYNMILKPPVVFVEKGISKLTTRRQKFEDLVRNDIYEEI